MTDAIRIAPGKSLRDTDVLVLGGGPAAAWAAVSAAEAGASVILSDKGWLGTSGATAPSNTGTWCVPPGDDRSQVVDRRWARTAGVADRRWMARTVDQSYRGLLRLADWGYPFPRDENGNVYIANLRGPDYMRFMRARVLAAKVTVLDHHPALELWSDGTSVTGASGLIRPEGQDWTIRARAVVLATGGCAFFERTSGAAGLTGDGLLMAAEAGAALSGMEFTGKYTLAPYGSSVNKGLPFRWASFYHADGRPLLNSKGEHMTNGIGGGSEGELARALIAGPVYARLDQCEPALQDWLRQGQPNVMQPYDRQGIDPFRDIFRVELKPEGTVRGIGGLRVATDDCGTDVPGLYVAGDAASREDVAGGRSGGGAINSSWAIASGYWAGRGAAAHARRGPARSRFRSQSAPLGQAGLRPRSDAAVDVTSVIAAVREEMAPLHKNFVRSEVTLKARLSRLDALWEKVQSGLAADGPARLRAREAAAALSAAWFSLTAARARTESRGMHRRSDFPAEAPGPVRRYPLTGPDEIGPAPEAVAQHEVAS